MTAIFDRLAAWREVRGAHARSGWTLGLVPTMGALHEGHLSLVRRSRAENDRTLVTVFVDPAQFDDPSDLARYPRVLADDVALLRGEGVDFILAPDAAEIYPDGFRFRVSEHEESRVMEGAHRPGHFDGVLTVVLKLLNVAAADRAYFGEKDWQQLSLVRGMAEAFLLPTAIVGCTTIREPDGLAASSRNRRLSAADRERAAEFPRALAAAASADDASRTLAAAGFAVDYVEDHGARRLGAVRLGGVRLIDNVRLETR